MGFKLIPLVMQGREFVDGELTEAAAWETGSGDDRARDLPLIHNT